MAQKLKKFIPLSNRMDPESSRFGTSPQLAANVVPAHNGFRALEEVQAVGGRAQGFWPYAFNSAFQHIFLADTSVQKRRAESDFSGSKSLVRLNASNSDTDLYTVIDEENADDTDFFVAGGASSAATAKFNVVEYDTPSGTANWKFRARYKVEGNDGGTANIAWTLYADNGSTVLDGPTNVYNSSASSSDGWQTFEDTFTGNLSWTTSPVVGFSLTTFGTNQEVVPTSENNSDNWKNASGATTDVYQSIDEGSSPSDADYAVSPALGLSGSTKYKVKLVAEDPLARRSAALTDAINVRWKKPQAGGTVSVKLLQGTTDPTTIATWSLGSSSAQASYVTSDLDLTAAEFNSISDFTDLWLEFTFTAGTAGTYIYDEVDPSGSTNPAGAAYHSFNAKWVDHTNNNASIHLDIDEGSDSGDTTTYIQPDIDGSIALMAPSSCLIDLGVIGARGHFTGSTLKFRCRTTTAGDFPFAVKVYRNITLITDTTVTAEAAGIATESLSIASSAIQNAVDAGQNIYVVLSDQASASGTRQIYSLWLEVPTQNSLYISAAWLSLPPRSYAAISHFEIEVPVGTDATEENKGHIYVGDLEGIYHVDENFVFTDVSIAGGYFTGNTPKAWRWAQWSNDVIATNYADPVQVREDSTGDFKDLITSTKQPRARDVIVVLDFVMLLNTVGESEAGPDVIWWSAVDDATDFDPSPTTQCDFQALKDTPGQITCGVGGEYGIVFKQNSIYKINFVGAPLTFSRFLLASHIGTEYPFSVVPVGRDIYFFDGVRFQVIRNGQEVVPLPGELNKALSDLKHSEFALIHEDGGQMTKEDIVIQGQYDSDTQCIFWLIKTGLSLLSENSLYSFHEVIVCYNTTDGRYSILTSEVDDDFLGNQILSSTLLGLKVYPRNKRNILKSIILFDYYQAKQFSGESKRSLLVDTGVFSIEDAPVNIHAIRPLYTIDAEDSSAIPANQGIEMTIESSDNHVMLNSTEVSSTTQNDEGWFMLRNSGSFHIVTFSMDTPANTLREIIGVEIEYSIEGQR